MALRICAQTVLAEARALRPATSAVTAPSLSLAARQYHHTPYLAAYKENQDRHSLDPRRSEGTKSGTDDDVAQNRVAFNSNKISPEEAKKNAATNGNPLDASGANQEFSKPKNPEEAMDKSDKKTKSGGGKGKKHGKVSPM